MTLLEYLKVFVWGFFLGAVSISAALGYVYVKMFMEDEATTTTSGGKGKTGSGEDEKKWTTSQILQSLGISPNSPLKGVPGWATKTSRKEGGGGLGGTQSPPSCRANSPKGEGSAASGTMTPPPPGVGGSPSPLATTGNGEAAAAPGEEGGEPVAGGGASVEDDPNATAEGDDRDLEEAFMEAVKLSKARLKDIKGLAGTIQTLTALTTAHAKALEKVASTSEAAGNQFKKETGMTKDAYWIPLGSTLDQISDEHRRLGEVLGKEIQEKVHQLLERHTLLDKQLNAEGGRLLKDLHDLTEAYRLQEKEYHRAQGRLQAFLEKGQKLGKVQSEMWESAEGKKLHKRLQEVESDLQSVDEKVMEANVAFNDKMPIILKDFQSIEKTSMDSIRVIVMDIGEQLRQAGEVDMKTSLQFCQSMQNADKNEYEVVLDDAMKNTERPDDSEKPFKLDMYSDAMAALAATNPARIPKLPSQLVAGIGKESCVWLNAFTGRMYRDACAAPLFHEWMSRLLSNLLNKGSRPGYIDEFQISNIRFGAEAVPPMLQNMRWLPTSALEGAEMDYDIAFTADMMYRGGFGFKVSTKLWLNWPMDRAAAIPMSVDIELLELSGQVRMGVRKHQSYASFLQEPHSRFSVKPVLGETKALTNVPKISSFMIKKMQQAIKSKLVYPKCKTFKLLWPKNWWPETTEMELLRRAGKPVPAHTNTQGISPPSTPSAATTTTHLEPPLSPLGTSETPAPYIQDDQGSETIKHPMPTTTVTSIPTSTTIPTTTVTNFPSSTTTIPSSIRITNVTTSLSNTQVGNAQKNGLDSSSSGEASSAAMEEQANANDDASASREDYSEAAVRPQAHTSHPSLGGGGPRKPAGRITGVLNNFSGIYKNVKNKVVQQTQTAGELTKQAINNHVRRHNSTGGITLNSLGSTTRNDSSTELSSTARTNPNNLEKDDGSDGGSVGGNGSVAKPDEVESDDVWDKLSSQQQQGPPLASSTIDMTVTPSVDHKTLAVAANTRVGGTSTPTAMTTPTRTASPSTPVIATPPIPQTASTLPLASLSQPLAQSSLMEVPQPTPGRPTSAPASGASTTMHHMWEGAWDEGENDNTAAESGRRGPQRRSSDTSSFTEPSTESEPSSIKVFASDKEGKEPTDRRYDDGDGLVQEENLVAVLDTESRVYQIRVKDPVSSIPRSMSMAPHMNGRHSRKATTDFMLPELPSPERKHRLVRRHTFACLTEHQAKYISIQCQRKSKTVNLEKVQDSTAKHLTSRDDSYEYSEQRNHWWTRQLQGIYTPPVVSTPEHDHPHHSGHHSGFSTSSLQSALKAKIAARAASPTLPAFAKKLFHKDGSSINSPNKTSLSREGSGHNSEDEEVVANTGSDSPTPFIEGSSSSEVMSGWLREDGMMGVASLAMQKKRWAKLQNGHLYLYENEKSQVPKAQLSVRRSVCRPLKDNKTFGFELNASKVSNGNLLSPKRTVFHAASEEEARQWINHLQQAANKKGFEEEAVPQRAPRGLSPAASMTG